MSTNPNVERYRNPDNDPRGPYLLSDITAPGSRPSLAFNWRGYSPPEGRCWRYSSEKLEELDRAGFVDFTGVRPRLRRYLNDFDDDQDASDSDDSVFSKIELLVRKTMRVIAASIAHNPAILNRVEWRDLERVMREVFEGLGFTTRLTRPGKDGGFDLELTCTENGKRQSFLVEIKHWVEGSKRPGIGYIKSFFEVVAKSDSNVGILLSSSGFTRGSITGRTEVESQMIRLGDSTKIASLCEGFVQRESGLWEPLQSLPELLIHGTE